MERECKENEERLRREAEERTRLEAEEEETERQCQETLYLPMTLKGVKVLVYKGSETWLVDNTVLQAKTLGLGHRRSMRLDDHVHGPDVAAWGSIVKGIEAGDDWLQLQQAET